MEQFGLANRVLPGAGVNGQHDLMRRIDIQFFHDADNLLQFFHQVRFILQTTRSIGNQDVNVARLRRLDGIENNRCRIRAGMLGNHRNIVALTPHLKLLYRRRAEGIARGQHHRFALLLKLTRQLADGGGFTDAVDANHQNYKWRLAFYVQRLVHLRQNIAHLFFQQAVQRLGVAQLLAAGVVGKISDDLTGGFHADIGNQQLLFQLFKQIIVDFLAAEQTDKSGTEVLLGFYQAAFEASEEPFFGGFFLL